MPLKVRVAAVQFGVGTNVDENLATCLRMIDQAALEKPDIMVLPEFVNHASWYEDKAHCYQVSVELDGPFLQAVAAKAAEHRCYIMINVTLRRGEGVCTGSNVLYDPQGEVVAVADKQVLMGHENDFLTRAQSLCPIIETPFGRLGMYSCMDGVINETPRGLALRGAQILLNSLNSFALDEASLHVPVRAPENRVFIVAANKVAPLIPEFLLAPVSEMTNIPVEFLYGAGESQIVGPDGTVLAKAPRSGEAVVIAELEVDQANNKKRPDGTDVFASRRPELYQTLAAPPVPREYVKGAETLEAAVYQPAADGAEAIEETADAVAQAASEGVQLIALPELFCFTDGLVQDPAMAVSRSKIAVEALSAALKTINAGVHVVTSLVERNGNGYQHVGVLISRDGIVMRQVQLHRSERHAEWVSHYGDEVVVKQMAWGRFAIIVGDDSLYPETFRLAALQNAEAAGVPLHIYERWELETGLLERSAENRLCLLVASRPTPFGASAMMTLHKDFTLMTPWESRAFDGNISKPIVIFADADARLTRGLIHPRRAENRFVSSNTDVVDGRPWHLMQGITG